MPDFRTVCVWGWKRGGGLPLWPRRNRAGPGDRRRTKPTAWETSSTLASLPPPPSVMTTENALGKCGPQIPLPVCLKPPRNVSSSRCHHPSQVACDFSQGDRRSSVPHLVPQAGGGGAEAGGAQPRGEPLWGLCLLEQGQFSSNHNYKAGS